jgi:hypothetical protein
LCYALSNVPEKEMPVGLTDIPILLIDLALIAIIVLPVVVYVAIQAAAREIVRPLWSLRPLLGETVSHIPSGSSPSLPAEPSQPTRPGHIANSALGR